MTLAEEFSVKGSCWEVGGSWRPRKELFKVPNEGTEELGCPYSLSTFPSDLLSCPQHGMMKEGLSNLGLSISEYCSNQGSLVFVFCNVGWETRDSSERRVDSWTLQDWVVAFWQLMGSVTSGKLSYLSGFYHPLNGGRSYLSDWGGWNPRRLWKCPV